MEPNCVSAGKSFVALLRADAPGKNRSAPAVGTTPPQLAGSVQLPPTALPPVHRKVPDKGNMSIVAVSSVKAPAALTRSVTSTVAGPPAAGAKKVGLDPTSLPR